MKHLYFPILILSVFFSSHGVSAQTFKAVNDTIDLYPGIPKTVNILENDTIPFGDSIKVSGGGTGGNLITITNTYLGFYTFLVKPIWGFNGNLSGSYMIIDYTLSRTSSAHILYRIHDHSYDSLEINNVKAAITASGNEFSLPANQLRSHIFRIPGNSLQGTMFTSSLWMGGKGADSTLYLAGDMYRMGPYSGTFGMNPDFYAGPVMDSVNYSIYQDTVWNRVWKIRKSEIEYHKAHWNSPGYIVPVNIATWPGNGNTAYGQAAQLAPYHDRNNDGIYNPADGDYPLIRGDEAIFTIYNDDRGSHKETLGNKMKSEIHLMAYAFDSQDSAFKNTIFFNYKIINRSPRTYYNTFFGAFADFDIGWFFDDYIECDVERASIIGFNGVPVDGYGQPQAYGTHPPAQSVTILGGPYLDPDAIDNPRFDNSGHQLCDESVNGTHFGDSIVDNERYGMTRFLFFDNDATFHGNPALAADYYNYLGGIWKNGQVMTYGGPGYTAGGSDCYFMFPGESDSLNWGTGCQLPNGPVNWTQNIAGIAPGDIRGLGSMGPFTFKPGDVQEVDLAFVFARDYTGQDTLEPSVAKLRQMIDIVRNSYNTGKLPDGNSFFGINEQTNTPSSKIMIYPNPASNRVNILLEKPFNEKLGIKIINTSGIEVYSSEIMNPGKKIGIDVSAFTAGMYIISVQGKDFDAKGKVIILK